MVDVSTNEMRDLLVSLSERLSNTTGDRANHSKLEEIRRILTRIQDDLSKNNAKAIGREVAAAISSELDDAIATTHTGPRDQTNTALSLSNQRIIDELHRINDGIRLNGGIGGRNATPLNSPFNVASARQTEKAFTDIAKAGIIVLAAFNKIKDVMLGTTDTYRRMMAAGQTWNDGLVGMRRTAADGNMSLATFSKAIENGSVGLRQLGANDFARASKNVRDSMRDMGNMGLTVDEVNSSLSDYIEQLRSSGNLAEVNNVNFNQRFQDMIASTTGLSAAFGVARDQIMKNAADLAKNGDLNILLSGLPQQMQEEFRKQFSGMDPQGQKIAMDALAAALGRFTPTYGINASVNAPLMEGLTRTYRDFINRRIDRAGMLQGERAAGQAQMEQTRRRGNQSAFYGIEGPVGEAIRGGIYLGNSFGAINPNAATTAEQNARNPDELTREWLKINETQERVARGIEAATTALISGMTRSLTEAPKIYNDAVDAYTRVLNDNLKSVSDHLGILDSRLAKLIDTIGIEGVGLIGALFLLGSAMNTFRGVLTLAKGAVSAFDLATRAFRPKTVVEPGAAGGASKAVTAGEAAERGAIGAGAGPRTAASRLGLARSFLRRSMGPLAFILEAMSTYSDIQEAVAQHNEGKLNDNEYKRKMVAAIGKGFGGVTGGILLAEAGAALGATGGTFVAPGVGTAIGGIAGGIGGGLAGAFGGEAVGQKTGEMLWDQFFASPQPKSPTPETTTTPPPENQPPTPPVIIPQERNPAGPTPNIPVSNIPANGQAVNATPQKPENGNNQTEAMKPASVEDQSLANLETIATNTTNYVMLLQRQIDLFQLSRQQLVEQNEKITVLISQIEENTSDTSRRVGNRLGHI